MVLSQVGKGAPIWLRNDYRSTETRYHLDDGRLSTLQKCVLSIIDNEECNHCLKHMDDIIH